MTSVCENARILQKIPAHTSDITSCDFSPNFTLVTGSSDKSVRIWEWILGTGYQEKSFSPIKGHKYGVTCVKISPQGSMLATTSIDGTAILWNLHSGTKIYTMVQMNGDAIRVCRFAPDSSVLATAGDNGAICFWDLVHRSLIRTVFQHQGTTSGLAFTNDSQFFVSACSLEVLNVWSMQSIADTTNDDPCVPLASQDNAHDLGVLSIDTSPIIIHEESNPFVKQYTLATSGNCDRLNLWRITCATSPKHSGEKTQVIIEKTGDLRGHTSAVTCVKYNHSGAMLVSSSLDKLVKIWNTNDWACLYSLQGHSRYVNCVSFSRDSTLVASGSTGSNDKSLIVWDLSGTLTLESELVRSHNQLGALMMGNGVQEGQVVREAEDADNTVTLLEKIDDIADSAINSCCFYGDNLLATGSSDKLVRLFKLISDGESILEETDYSPLEGHSYAVNYIEFSKDGAKLASASLDGYATIWNPDTGEKMNTIPENTLGVRVSRFSPDGFYLLTAGDDEKATIWNSRTMEKVGQLEGHSDAVTSACFSPDGQIIATVCSNGDFRLWNMSANIHIQDDAHDLGIQCCDFSQSSEPLPNFTAIDVKNYLLATCGNDSMVKLWSISLPVLNGQQDYKQMKVKLWRVLQGHGGSVTYVRFSNASEIICSTATDRQARIWSVYSAECLHVLDHDSIVTTCSFSSNCAMLATGCLDKTLWIWKLPQQLVFQTVVANKIKCRTKAVMDWSNSDVLKWLEDVGLHELREDVVNTTLDGQKLLTYPMEKICAGLHLDEVKSEKLVREMKWLRQLELQQTSIWDRSDIPVEYLCPITHEIMREPVTVSDGFTYEKQAITEWFMAGKFTSPMTNATLENTDYTPNLELRNLIYSYLCDNEK